jgi:hypothetical protein
MGEVINLRKWRAQREREAAAATAAANRIAHGRTKAEKRQEAAEAARRQKLLDAAQRDDAPER